MSLIASGSLLAAVDKKDVNVALASLKKAGIDSVVVGYMGQKLKEPVPEIVEELWRLLKMEKISEK